MRLAVLNLTGGGISGGHKKYLLNILPRLAASPEIEAVLCASPGPEAGGDWLPRAPKISYVTCAPFRPFRHVPDAGLAASLDDFKPDLIFIPIERYLNYKGLPVVVMLQNMAPLAGVKTGFGFKEKLVALARLYETKTALRRAAAVIVPTGYVNKFLVEKAGIPAKKITAIHYGGNPAAGPARPPGSFPFKEGGFIFTAGSMEAYRGIEDLILALPALKARHPGIKLAVAGRARPAAPAYLDKLKKLAAELKVSTEIAWLGNLPEEELSWCYSNCAAFVLTSRMESFCFVALEAMTHGCNIVSSSAASLPEILGETALYYAPGDSRGLSAALLSVLGREKAEAGRFSAEASARAGEFSWERAAAGLLDVLSGAAHPGLPKVS